MEYNWIERAAERIVRRLSGGYHDAESAELDRKEREAVAAIIRDELTSPRPGQAVPQ